MKARNCFKHLVKLMMILLLGLFATGFIAGTMEKAIPEWTNLGDLVRLAGMGATLFVAVAHAFGAARHAHDVFRWNLKGFLRVVAATAIVFFVSAGGNHLATAILAGRPPGTGMTGGALDPSQIPVLHLGTPLIGLALAVLCLVWPWLRPRNTQKHILPEGRAGWADPKSSSVAER